MSWAGLISDKNMNGLNAEFNSLNILTNTTLNGALNMNNNNLSNVG